MGTTHSGNSTPPIDETSKRPRTRDIQTGSTESNPWKENHGNWLLGFTALLCVIGAAVIGYQQSRFQPPRFPTGVLLSGDDAVGGESNGSSNSVVNDSQNRSITLRILGAGSDEGVIKIAMYREANGFNDPARALDVDNWKISGGICEGRLVVPSAIDRLAIAAYHDVNGNGTLDRNPLGIPSERYGFSGGARGLTGPPSFDEAVVALGDAPIDISIR